VVRCGGRRRRAPAAAGGGRECPGLAVPISRSRHGALPDVHGDSADAPRMPRPVKGALYRSIAGHHWIIAAASCCDVS
jgi:hypothetical protein